VTRGKLDKRTLLLLAAGVVLVLVLRVGFPEDALPRTVAPEDSVALVEKRLARLRQMAALLPGKEKILTAISADLAQREKGMIQADTAPQAQAQLLQVLRRVSAAQSPVIELKTAEIGTVQPLGDQYAEVAVPVAFQCRIEQLLNLLADLTAQPEALATKDVRISIADLKQKTLGVRLTVAAVAARRLTPHRGGGPAL
jgi:hypothetical protein